MSFIRYKTFGKQEYAYEISAFWDKKTQSPKQKSRYMGVVVDKKKKIFERRAQKKIPERLILDYGDSFVIQKFLEQTGFWKLLYKIFGSETQMLQALITYRLSHGSAMIMQNLGLKVVTLIFSTRRQIYPHRELANFSND